MEGVFCSNCGARVSRVRPLLRNLWLLLHVVVGGWLSATAVGIFTIGMVEEWRVVRGLLYLAALAIGGALAHKLASEGKLDSIVATAISTGVLILLVFITVESLAATSDSEISGDNLAAARVIRVQSSVDESGLPVVKAMLTLQTCEISSNCESAIRNFRATLLPYSASLGAGIDVLSEINFEEIALNGFVRIYVDVLQVRLEAVHLYMRAVVVLPTDYAIDEVLLATASDRWNESVLRMADVSDFFETDPDPD